MKSYWKILISIGIFLLVVLGVSYVFMRLQPASELDAYKKSLREKGEKLEISEVQPPPVAPESNSVTLIQSAFGLLTYAGDEQTNLPETMQMVAPGRAMIGWQQADVRTSEFTNSWENVVAAAEAHQPGIKLLIQAAAYPAIDFKLDYKKGPDLMLPQLDSLHRAALWLSTKTMCDLHNGNSASATTNLCAMLSLVRGERNERMLVSQLVRITITSIATSASWELLQSTNVSEPNLAKLQKAWEQLDFIEGMEGAFLMERALTEGTIQKMRSSKAEFDHMMGMYVGGVSSSPGGVTSPGDWLSDMGEAGTTAFRKVRLTGSSIMWRTSWTYSDELNALKNYQDILEAFRLVETNQVFQPAYSNLMNQLYPSGMSRLYHSNGVARVYEDVWDGLDVENLRQLFSRNLGFLTATVRKTMAAEASKRIVITAIALKRFQLQRGFFPENISELTPEFLTLSPLDPVDGQPLRYRQNADGTYLLYSIGEDGVDDGGDANSNLIYRSKFFYWQGNKIRDWVWPQPATAFEIYRYDEEQAKK